MVSLRSYRLLSSLLLLGTLGLTGRASAHEAQKGWKYRGLAADQCGLQGDPVVGGAGETGRPHSIHR